MSLDRVDLYDAVTGSRAFYLKEGESGFYKGLTFTGDKKKDKKRILNAFDEGDAWGVERIKKRGKKRYVFWFDTDVADLDGIDLSKDLIVMPSKEAYDNLQIGTGFAGSGTILYIGDNILASTNIPYDQFIDSAAVYYP